MNFEEKYINPLTDFGFEKLFKAAEIAQFTPEERKLYEDSLKYYRDIKNVVDTSREEGVAEGIEQGLEQGLEQGIEQGIERTAKEMKKDGVSIEKIMQYTGLSKDEINKL